MTFTCPICDNSDYEETDGLYYCTVCNTQSTEMIRQEANDAFPEHTVGPRSFQYLIRTGGTTEGRKSRNDHGRPWTIYEAYQFIIMAQADALINLGELKVLKEYTYSIWAKYLSKLGVAFCHNEQVVPDVVASMGCGRQRELHRGSLANPINRNKRPFDESDKKPRAKKRKKSNSDSDEDVVEVENSEEEVTNVKRHSRDTDNVIFVDESVRTEATYQRAQRSMEWMDMKKTIAITFLGVQCTNPLVIPADFIRWIYEGKIPFLSVTHLLPPDVVMSGKDYALFGPLGLDANQLILEVNRMKTFLNLKTLPEASIPLLIERFLKELDLPDKLLAVCINLTSSTTHSMTLNKKKYKRPEIAAVLYIGLALKLLFGLDDRTERKLSSYSMKVREMLNSGTNVFVFDEWKSHQLKKSYLKFEAVEELNENLTPRFSSEHPDKLLKSYDNFKRDEKHLCWKENYIAMSKQDKCRQTFRDPLMNALEKQRRESKETSNAELEIEMVGKRLRDSCLSHITDFSCFQTDHGEKLRKKDYRNLKKDLKTITRTIIYADYEEEGDRKALLTSRPRTYSWLLQLMTKIADCSVTALDTGLIKMQKQLKNKLCGS